LVFFPLFSDHQFLNVLVTVPLTRSNCAAEKGPGIRMATYRDLSPEVTKTEVRLEVTEWVEGHTNTAHMKHEQVQPVA